MSSKEEIRSKIDKIDDQVLKLLLKRSQLAQKVIQFKKVLYDPGRELQIMERLYANNSGPLTNESVNAIYREIIGACRDLQKPIVVAYLGPRATYSNAAALKKFGSSIIEMPCADIPAVFDEVEKDAADFGVVPFENSTEGVINYTLDRFATTPLNLCGEIILNIGICLLSQETDLSKIKRIFAHPKVIEQTSKWLRNNAEGKEIIQVSSTSRAAQRASKAKGTAALASSLAAEVYGLKILERRVEDLRDNKTRFLILGKDIMQPSGKDKTSVLFTVRHEAGTLYRALRAFEKHGVNLTMMQARPSKNIQWEYNFFIDLLGHVEDLNIRKALIEMNKFTVTQKVMGSYPEDLVKK